MAGILKSLVSGTAILALSHSTFALTPEQACSVSDRSDTVVLMLCPGPLDEKVWIEAGRAACSPGRQCNVWIWDDKAKMPKRAPRTDADLAKEHSASATAIWVNDSQSLMRLRKAR